MFLHLFIPLLYLSILIKLRPASIQETESIGIKSGNWRVREKLAGVCELEEGVGEKAPSWAALLCPQHFSDSGRHGFVFGKAFLEKWVSDLHAIESQAATKDDNTVSWGSSKAQAPE